MESFIAYCIDSVEQVEVLLLLSATRDRSWTMDDISAHLRSSVRSVGLRLGSLVAHGLIKRDGMAFRYDASHADDRLVQRLAEVYQERRPAVIDRIFSLRDPMRTFADAFRLKEQQTDG
ncbi:MAG: hypothetical protein ACRENA_17220 [Vulcanimicrobiaceae bacterium]